MALAPIVVLARVDKLDGKLTLAVDETWRGGPLPARLLVAFRSVNFGRQPGAPAFAAREGEQAVFLLSPWVDAEGQVARADLYRPVGGHLGRLPLPAEGAGALLAALRELVQHQDGVDPRPPAVQVADWLQGSNPWLIDAGLELAARAAVMDRELTAALIPWARDVQPARRRRVVQALDHALARDRRRGGTASPKDDQVLSAAIEAIVRLARSDPDVAVRGAAVSALGSGGVPHAAALLAVIARDDPDQSVRYAAAAGLARLGAR